MGFVCVDEAFQGTALSRRLISTAIKVDKDRTFDILVLWTNDFAAGPRRMTNRFTSEGQPYLPYITLLKRI